MTEPRSGTGKRGKNLTPGEVRSIAERIAAGEPHAAIATRFGVSGQTVRAIKSGKRCAGAIDDALRARMQVAPAAADLDAVRARQVIAALEEGRTGRSIAEEFGVSPSLVSAIKRGRAWAALAPDLPARLGREQPRGKALSAQQVARIKGRLLKGASSRTVAAEFGVSASTILAIARGRTWAEVEPRE